MLNMLNKAVLLSGKLCFGSCMDLPAFGVVVTKKVSFDDVTGVGYM